MRVFISYARRDKAALRNLLSAFQAARLQVWWDEQLGGGELWWRGVLEQIRRCEVFAFAMSQNSLDSKSCLAELKYAQAVCKPVLPVQIGAVDSMRANPFAEWHVIDYRDPSGDTAIRLIDGVRRARRQPLPNPLPPEPPMPYEFVMRMKALFSGPQLIPTEQQQLLFELNQKLNEEAGDPAARADISALLFDLRDRPDTTDETRAEIDTIVKSMKLKRPGARRFSRAWLLAGAGLALAVVVAIVVGSVMLPGRQVTTERLNDVLLSDNDVDTVMHTDMSGGEILQETGEIVPGFTPPECIGTLYNGNIAVYKDTGYSDTRTQALKHPPKGDADAVVYQSAFLFPSPARASEMVHATGETWKKTCSDRLVTVTEPDGNVSTWAFEPVADTGSQILVNATMSKGGEIPYACQKVMRAESNVGIEVLVCSKSAHIGHEAVGIAEKMASTVTGLTSWPRRWLP